MHNLLTEAVITVDTGGCTLAASLPRVLGLLQADRAHGFAALRPHQAPAWHAFLVQLSVLATEDRDVPQDESGWAAALRALTPDWPEDEPWCLVAPAAAPAFLQPAAPGRDIECYGTVVATPDELDPLVTSKNHDLKAARMSAASAEDWIYALVNLQTTEGVMGAGKYGVMRMNGGYGSRPFIGAAPSGAGPGARFCRDFAVLRRSRNVVFAAAEKFATDREAKLLWLEPWDGTRSLGVGEIHPLSIEICRRIRLEDTGDGSGLRARGTGTNAPRIAAKELRGVTGDPWAPVGADKDGAKVLSVTGAGFGWELMRDLLIGGGKNSFTLPLLAKPAIEDGAVVEIHAAALARGQGKTEGFHTRTLTVRGAAALRALSGEEAERKRLAELSQRLSGLAMSAARQCLRPALFLLFQKGPAQAKLDRPATATQVAPWMARFDRLVDRAYFDALWPGLENDDARADAERAWIERLHAFASEVFEAASEAAPSTDQRRILAAQRARDLLRLTLRKHLPVPKALAE